MRHVAAFLDAGHTAEVIVQNDLPHVDAAAIHEAIAYYFDHRTEIEAELTANTPEAVSQQFQQRLTPPNILNVTVYQKSGFLLWKMVLFDNPKA